MLEFVNPNRFKAMPHRVRSYKMSRERISIPFFVYPSVDKVLVQQCQLCPSSVVEKEEVEKAVEEVKKKVELKDRTRKEMFVREVMLRNFASIWETKKGTGHLHAKDYKLEGKDY